jgi:PKD repeat protein
MRPLLLLLLVTGLASPCAHGQLFDLGLRSSGPPCDSSLVVDFSVTDNGLMSYTFTADIDTGSVTITGLAWTYFNITLSTNVLPSFTEQYYVPGQYPVCLTVDALDQQAQPCVTSTCELVSIYADSSCSDLVADFTITGIAGNMVSFGQQASFTGPIAGYQWTFGDGTSDTSPDPSHTFAGTGPYEVCLTVAAAQPDDECFATECKWLYLGPGSVPCSTLLDQGFLVIAMDNTVGVLDTSTTSGMNYTVDWDFGDGYTSSGQVAYHSYLSSGVYNVCETITLWGPLNPDTCVNTVCTPVSVYVTGVGEALADGPVRAWPNPAHDRLLVAGLPPDVGTIDLVDALGRRVRTWSVGPQGNADLGLAGLAPGTYGLRARTGRWLCRVVKDR